MVITAADRCPASSAACGHAPAFSRAAFAEFLSIAGRLEGLKPASMMGSLYRHSAAFHPRPRAQRHGQGLPASNGPGTRAGLRVVGDGWEQPSQLDRGRELAALLVDGADRGGLSLADNEHAGRMGVDIEDGKRPVPGRQVTLVPAARCAATVSTAGERADGRERQAARSDPEAAASSFRASF